jgi:hypothetical protein
MTYLQSHYILRKIVIITLGTDKRAGQTMVDIASTMVAPTFKPSLMESTADKIAYIPQPLWPSEDSGDSVYS